MEKQEVKWRNLKKDEKLTKNIKYLKNNKL
jgi:hypothetical protein